MDYKDLFSAQSQDYARFRPRYPAALFAYLSSLVSDHRAAWDCGTGSGQAAVELAAYFAQVFATDPSEKQLAQAEPHPGVQYLRGTAEASGLAAQAVTLITVAQAFHWFRQEAFFDEVRRVAKPGESALAIWSYNLAQLDPRVDEQLGIYYHDVVGRYWEPERLLVEEGYASVPVPLDEIEPPPLRMEARWTLPHLMGYLNTWSSTQSALRATGRDHLQAFAPNLVAAWGPDAKAEKAVTWKLRLRVFRL